MLRWPEHRALWLARDPLLPCVVGTQKFKENNGPLGSHGEGEHGLGLEPKQCFAVKVPTARMGNDDLISVPMATANGVMHLTHAA